MAPTQIQALLVERSGTLKSVNLGGSAVSEDVFFRKCNFKSREGFALRGTYAVPGETTVIHVYGKDQGVANTENKYELPPPLDQALYFGSLLLVAVDNGKCVALSKEQWLAVYNHHMGGFDDTAKAASEEEEQIEQEQLQEEAAVLEFTKEGYAKDGFVVDDDEPVEQTPEEPEEPEFVEEPDDPEAPFEVEEDEDEGVSGVDDAELQEDEYDYDPNDPRLQG